MNSAQHKVTQLEVGEQGFEAILVVYECMQADRVVAEIYIRCPGTLPQNAQVLYEWCRHFRNDDGTLPPPSTPPKAVIEQSLSTGLQIIKQIRDQDEAQYPRTLH